MASSMRSACSSLALSPRLDQFQGRTFGRVPICEDIWTSETHETLEETVEPKYCSRPQWLAPLSGTRDDV
jgi:hypothetical protein